MCPPAKLESCKCLLPEEAFSTQVGRTNLERDQNDMDQSFSTTASRTGKVVCDPLFLTALVRQPLYRQVEVVCWVCTTYLCTCNVLKVGPVHLGTTVIVCMDQLVCESVVHVTLRVDIVLTQDHLGEADTS